MPSPGAGARGSPAGRGSPAALGTPAGLPGSSGSPGRRAMKPMGWPRCRAKGPSAPSPPGARAGRAWVPRWAWADDEAEGLAAVQGEGLERALGAEGAGEQGVVAQLGVGVEGEVVGGEGDV